MRKAVLLASLMLSISYAAPADPCTQYKNIQQQCSECRAQKTCGTEDRVYCAQLHHYSKQCYYYNQSLSSAKNNTAADAYRTQTEENKANTPTTNLQKSFDSGTPDSLQNKLHLYNNDIIASKPMQEVVAPTPKAPEGTPTKTPSPTDHILKSWY